MEFSHAKNYLVFQARKTAAGCQDCAARMTAWMFESCEERFLLWAGHCLIEGRQFGDGAGRWNCLNAPSRVFSLHGGLSPGLLAIRVVKGA